MKLTFRFLLLYLFVALAVLSCKEDVVDVKPEDTDSSVVWHYGDMELLDSVSEYAHGVCTLRVAWKYDAFGRPIERNECRHYDNEDHYKRSSWGYSDGGKTITIVYADKEGNSWKESAKDVITVVADRDSCTERYKKVGIRWILEGYAEVAYDSDGRLLLSYSYMPDENNGSKREFAYDSKGRCILDKIYSWRNGEWIESRQTDYAFDDRGNCVYCKAQKYYSHSGSLIGDSLVECAFDGEDHITAYSLMKWDIDKDGWIGRQKYEISYDEYGNVTENTVYDWDADADKWVPKSKSSKSYDSEGHTLSNAEYSWYENAWRGLYRKMEWSYDDSGNLASEKSYLWNLSEACWELEKTDLYDPEGNICNSVTVNSITTGETTYLSRCELTWADGKYIREETSYVNDVMKSGSRQVYCQDEAGRDTFIVVSSWLRGEWVEQEKIYDRYDKDGIKQQSLRYSYNNNDGKWFLANGSKWVTERNGNIETRQEFSWNMVNKTWDECSAKYFITYDEHDRVVESLCKNKVWDDAVNTHWENSDKTEYTYDGYGNNTGFVDYNWYSPENKWIPGEKKEMAFDANGNKILEAGYMYDASQSHWFGGGKYTAEYDDNDRIVLETSYSWGSTDWVPGIKTEYSYDEDGNKSDVKRFDWSYKDGGWYWKGVTRTVYAYDPETKTSAEYNLTFDYASQTWKGHRSEKVTDENGNVIRTTDYSWLNERWVIWRQYDWSFDARGNVVCYIVSTEDDEGMKLLQQIDYTYDSKNRLVSQVEKNLLGTVTYARMTYYSTRQNAKIIDGMEF